MKHIVIARLHVSDLEALVRSICKYQKLFCVCIECQLEDRHTQECSIGLALRNANHELHCEECQHTSINNKLPDK